MQANKISIHGNLYFVPNPNLALLNLLEDYIAAISEHNLNKSHIISNSMFVVDDEKQRQKMTEEFYVNYKRDIEACQKAIQRFIDIGCVSPKVSAVGCKKSPPYSKRKQPMRESCKDSMVI